MKPEKVTLAFIGEDGEKIEEELNICFNMATEIAYEQVTGQAFDPSSLDKVETTIALYYAAILANNLKTKIKLEHLMYQATATDISALRKAVLKTFGEWANVPDIMLKEQEGKEEESPNP